ncbi:MAG: repeat, subgroup [Flavipsychrobacter sp.]|jgi:energy-coupling factor transporter ATP-binding protein EcfA2|nr:repeat, subgroup [Flavipsychrobacter sp.]
MEVQTKLINPFPGLRAFEEEEDILFFGREKQIDELLRKLRTSRFLAIIGSSGSGKSSLVKSGLLTSLHSGLMSGVGSQWRVALFRPGNDPIGQMNEALCKNGVLRDDQSQEDEETNKAINETILRRSNLGLIEAYKQSGLDKRNNLLVLVDQFEELFRFSKYEKDAKEGKRDSVAFINLLLKAAEQKEFPIYVVFTMRSDFLGDCTEFRGLPEAINEGQYLVPRMTREERREAITGPIAVGGASITPALVNRLLNDVGDNPDQLPILQHALMRTWDEWKKNGKPDQPIDIEDYEHIGTITEALSQHAEEAFSELANDKERQICEKIFKELTDKGGLAMGIRRPRLLSELSAAANVPKEEVIKVVELFRKTGRGFLMPPPSTKLTEHSIIDISHESLMRVWKRLITWLEEEEESAQVYLHLCEAVNLYETGKGGLWRDPELQIAIKWKEEQNTNAAWASRYNPYYDKAIFFLDHSRQQRDMEIKHKEELQRQRLRITRRISIIVSVIALLAFMLAILAYDQKNRAARAQVEADNKRKEALEQKSIADKNKEEALNEKAIAEAAKDSAEKSQKIALEQKQIALKQEGIAKQESKRARIAESDAKKSAEDARISAEDAKRNAERAERSRKEADSARFNALREKAEAERLGILAKSKNYAHNAVLKMNENDFQNSRDFALRAYSDNLKNKGGFQDNDIYFALYLTWQNLVGNANNKIFHERPVRAMAGLPHSNILFSGDEAGSIIVFQSTDGVLKEKATVNTHGEIRSLTVSPSGDNLLVVMLDKAIIYTTNNEGTLKELTRVTFIGKGRKGLFIDNKSFLVQSTDGVTRFEVKNGAQTGEFGQVPNCVSVATGGGKIFIANAKTIMEYAAWDQVPTKPAHIYPAPFQVTSMSTDRSGKYLAVGMYNGGVMVRNLNSGTIASSALHRSAVNDLKFCTVSDGVLQLATASSDKTVKLTQVTSSGELNTDDAITIQQHFSWVYSLYYTSDNKYLFSGGEDMRIVGYPTTMTGVYNLLTKK